MKNLKSITLLSTCVITLVGFNYLYANTWTAAPANPPTNNVAAPINVSGTVQNKAPGGQIGADVFTARTQLQSDRYCNAAGDQCLNFSQLGGSAAPSSPLLVNEVHTFEDCQSAGGTVVLDSSDNTNFCRIPRSSCPSGWTRYKYWSAAAGGGQACPSWTGGWSVSTPKPWSNDGRSILGHFCSGRVTDNGCTTDHCARGGNPYEIGCY